jgi:hypothetical protein
MAAGQHPAPANGSSPPSPARANVPPRRSPERIARLIRNGAVRDEPTLAAELAELPDLAPAVELELRELLEREHGAPAGDNEPDEDPEP